MFRLFRLCSAPVCQAVGLEDDDSRVMYLRTRTHEPGQCGALAGPCNAGLPARALLARLRLVRVLRHTILQSSSSVREG